MGGTGHTTRRTMLVGGGCAVVTWLGSSCAGDDAGDGETDGGSGGSSGSSSTTDASTTSGSATSASTTEGATTSTTTDASTTGASGGSTTDDGSTGTPSECMSEYLAGGTASMAGDYPNPFNDAPQSCELFTAQTCGPCYALGPERKDITDGLLGLPTRLNLRVVYEGTCEPVVGAVVDVWFCNREGEYSGNTPSNICQNGNADVITEDFMRGQQATDASGHVEFDAVFPGWYPGRTTHIHVLFIVGDTAHYVTQLYFEDALAEGIYLSHPDYDHRPNRTTNNAGDGPFDPASPNLMNTRRTYDCAMQAWATIAIPANPVGLDC